MGKFATGVTVITTGQGKSVRGMTANAFMSLSLDPKLVVISIKNDARILQEMENNKSFAVSVLKDSQEYESKIFAGQIQPEAPIEFADLDGKPVIENAIVQVACDISANYIEGDHTLYIGKVTAIEMNEGNPLLFFNGKYQQLKQPLNV